MRARALIAQEEIYKKKKSGERKGRKYGGKKQHEFLRFFFFSNINFCPPYIQNTHKQFFLFFLFFFELLF